MRKERYQKSYPEERQRRWKCPERTKEREDSRPTDNRMEKPSEFLQIKPGTFVFASLQFFGFVCLCMFFLLDS